MNKQPADTAPKASINARLDNYESLLKLLDVDELVAGRKYEQLRQRLVLFFDRSGCRDPEAEADETISRTARNVGTETVQNVTAYVLGIAKNRRMEIFREIKRNPVKDGDFDELTRTYHATPRSLGADTAETEDQIRHQCLELCLKRLSKKDRELLLSYYQESGGEKLLLRKELAAKLGLSKGALGTRICRVKAELADCCNDCASKSLKC